MPALTQVQLEHSIRLCLQQYPHVKLVEGHMLRKVRNGTEQHSV